MDELQLFRKRIDEIDDQILLALCERVKICKVIGAAKKRYGTPIKDLSREKEVYNRIKEQSAQLGFNAGQVEAVYREIVNMCSTVQE